MKDQFFPGGAALAEHDRPPFRVDATIKSAIVTPIETGHPRFPMDEPDGAKTLKDTLPTKETNPKEAAGDTKVALALLSPIAKIKWAMAQFAGMLKYGAWNWRAAGVRHSTYLSAIQRHVDGIISGEDLDPVDGTDHYGNIMACCAIVLDARAAGKLNDDRAPVLDHRPAIAEAEQLMVKLKAQYAGKTPKHWTIGDQT